MSLEACATAVRCDGTVVLRKINVEEFWSVGGLTYNYGSFVGKGEGVIILFWYLRIYQTEDF